MPQAFFIITGCDTTIQNRSFSVEKISSK